MDTMMIKRIGLVFAGGVAGGFIGYLAAELILRREAQKDLDFELKTLTGEFEVELPLKSVVIVKKVDEDPALLVKKEKPSAMIDGAVSDIRKKREKKDKRNYTDYSKKDKGKLNELVAQYVPPQKIGVIPLKEIAAETGPIHSLELITYYEDDLTFCDSEEKIISDPNTIFGANVHLQFGNGSDDPDVVYVRNEKLGIDYEITRVHNSYSVVVLGVPLEEPKPPKSKRQRNSRKSGDDDEREETQEE